MQMEFPSAHIDSGLRPADPGVRTPGDWSVGKYFLVLAAVGIPSAAVIGLGLLVHAPWQAAMVAALPLAVLTLLKPEIGLYAFALWYPFENFALVGDTTISKILGFVILGAALVHSLRGGLLPLRVSAFWLALAFAVWSGLTLVGSRMPEVGLSHLLTRLQLIGLVFVVLSVCSSREKAETLFWVMFWGTLVASVAAFFLAPAAEEEWQVRRLTISGGTLNVGANSLAKTLMPVFFLGPFLFLRTWRPFRPFIVLGVIVVLAALIGSGSRSNYAAALGGFVVMVLSSRGVSVGRRVLLASSAVLLVVGLVAFGVATGLFGGLLWERIVELQERGLAEGQREALWITALKMGFAHPLMGVGVGNIRVEMLMAGVPVRVAHNDFLNHFAETGLPGLALYVAFLAAVARSAWRTADPWLRAGLLGLIAAAVLSTVGNPSYGEKCFWLQMGLCLLGATVFGPGPGATSTSPSADWPAPAALGPDLLRRPPWGRT